jgi:hypothetical protein
MPDLSFDPASRRGRCLSTSSQTTIGLGGAVGRRCGKLQLLRKAPEPVHPQESVTRLRPDVRLTPSMEEVLGSER